MYYKKRERERELNWQVVILMNEYLLFYSNVVVRNLVELNVFWIRFVVIVVIVDLR